MMQEPLKQLFRRILTEIRCNACAAPFISNGAAQAERRFPLDPLRNGAANFFCPDCLDLLFSQAADFCRFCTAPAQAKNAGNSAAENLPENLGASPCLFCPPKPCPWTAGVVFGAYKEFLRDLVLRLKFGKELSLCHALGNILALKVEAALLCAVDLVVPVPLHNSKLNERGFNQSHELAGPIARRLGVPLEHKALRRQRKTASQSGLDYDARMKNLSGAFQAAPARLNGANVLLVDDVFTTGATLAAAATELRKAGARNISIACLARTPRER